MDQAILVEHQIDDGQKYVDRLIANGIDVAVAFWLKDCDDERWYLYIATRAVDDLGQVAAYRAYHGATKGLQSPWMGMFQVKLISPESPLAKDAIAFLSTHQPSSPFLRFPGPRLGGTNIDGAIIYSPSTIP